MITFSSILAMIIDYGQSQVDDTGDDNNFNTDGDGNKCVGDSFD